MEDLGPPRAFVSLSAALLDRALVTPSRLPRTLLLPPASHTGHQYKITKLKNYIQPQKLVCKQIYVLMLRLEAAAWGGTASSAVEAAPWVAIPCTRAEQYDSSHYLPSAIYHQLSIIYFQLSTIYHLLSTMSAHRQLKAILSLVLWFQISFPTLDLV